MRRARAGVVLVAGKDISQLVIFLKNADEVNKGVKVVN